MTRIRTSRRQSRYEEVYPWAREVLIAPLSSRLPVAKSGFAWDESVKHFSAIAAMSVNRVIGLANKIPWYLPEDFKWFKKITTGQVVVMGRRTFESIGKPLRDRSTIVVSRSHFRYPGVRTVSDLNQIQIEGDPRQFFICGGAQIYAVALPLCADLYLTLVKKMVAGDAFFPPFEDQFVAREEILDCAEFKITRYRNITL
jgi:dihydrofolate reductase